MLEAPPRILDLEGCPNFRHIGGYATKFGSRTAEHLFRSGSLHRVEEDAIGQLTTFGIRTVVDLRSAPERVDFKTPDLSPFAILHVVAPVFEHDASPPGLAKEFPGFAEIYRTFLETGRDAYKSLIETVAWTEGGLLYHCAVGKDRTGVATALLLDLVGVEADTIVEDYSHSGRLLEPMLPQWVEGMKSRGIDPGRAPVLMASPRADMAATLDHLRDRYGDAEGYFLEIGVSAQTIEDARSRILE